MGQEDNNSTCSSEQSQDRLDRLEYQKKTAGKAELEALADRLNYLEKTIKDSTEEEWRKQKQHDHQDSRQMECEDTDATPSMQSDQSFGGRPKKQSRDQSLKEWGKQKWQDWEESIHRRESEIHNLLTKLKTTEIRHQFLG